MGKRLIIKGADFSTNGIDAIVDLGLEHGAYIGNSESSWTPEYSYFATSKRLKLNNGLYLKTKQDYCIVGLVLYEGMTGDMSGRFFASQDTVTEPVTDSDGRTQEWRIFSQNIGNYPIIKVMVQRENAEVYSPITLDQSEIFETVEYINQY